MLFKAIAHAWANSRLRKEEARTQSLVRELDRAKEAASKRIQMQKNSYADKVNLFQKRRNEELESLIEFMNQQLKITSDFLPELKKFQTFVFTCVESWFQVDFYQQKINIVHEQIHALTSTMSLLNEYISELTKLSQRQGRHTWRELTAQRRLTITSDFIEKTNSQISRASKTHLDEFKNELNRLRSQHDALYKEVRGLHAERSELIKLKKAAHEQHVINKNILAERYDNCAEHWKYIAKRFEAYYAFKDSELPYVNEWLAPLSEGGTLPEIIQVLSTANERVRSASELFKELNDEYQPYKQRVKYAHDNNEYPSSFDNDKAQKNRLAPQVSAAFKDKKAMIDARSFLYNRRDELRGYITRIKPLHPDTVIDALSEMLSTDRDFNAWQAFGISTSKLKREHWEKKQNRRDNAIAN